MSTLTAKLSFLGLAILVAGGAAGCAGDSQPQVQRPATPARVRIVEPTPDQTTGPDLVVRAELTGAEVVTGTRRVLQAGEGHLHLFVDGQLVSTEFPGAQDVRGLFPGPHSVQVEFVAADDAPFRSRVVAAVLFTVAG
jgi:hypothetical protein